MPDSPHVAVVRRLYEARGNADIIRQVVAPDVRWEVVEGFPYGGVYVGLDDVLRNFFGRLFQDCESFVAVGSEFFESDDHVIVLGTYTARAKATGRDFTARFAHVWTLQRGKIIRLQQCADTVQIAHALAG
jgi:ketosteroid isomerase-like protein